MGFFLNTFLLHDLHCMVALEKWRKLYRIDYSKWVHTVAEIEYLNSLAFFAFNHPDYIFPTLLQQDSLQIKAIDMGHPLIPASQRIVNGYFVGTAAAADAHNRQQYEWEDNLFKNGGR